MPTAFAALVLPLALAGAAFVQPSVQTAKPPEPVATPAPTTDILNYQSYDERMTVPVTIGGAGPYGFIVDTGAQRTVISRQLAGSLGLETGPLVNVTAMAGTETVSTVVIPKISVSALGGTQIQAPALDGRNIGGPGLLGIDTLQGHALTIDFAKQQMTVAPATKRTTRESLGPEEIIVHARNVFGQLVVTDAFYRGQRVQVIIDTGSVVSLGNLAFRKLAVFNKRLLKPISLLSVTGGTLLADYTQLDRMKVAGLDFTNLPIAFADAAPFRRFNLIKRPAVLLGMDTLKLFKRVRIDFANREVRLIIADNVPRI